MRSTTAGRHYSEIVEQLVTRPDEVMLEVGASGELLVARLRVAVAAMLLLLPLANATTGGQFSETLIGLAGAVFVNIFAQVWLALARHGRRFRWLPFASGAYDVTATTLVLLMLAWNHLPAGVNSMIVWCGYLLAIALTALRNDGRVTLFVGGLAIAQYALLSLGVFTIATPDQLISSDYGTVTAGGQLQRLVLLAAFTLITAVVVYRMQRLVEMSGTDGLTELPNRTWLVHRFPRLLDAARRDGVSLCVALIDLDHFKRINDEIGHHAGDRALMHVVDMVRDSLEDGEWLARLGGEEFVLVLRKPLGTAWERVDGLRRTLFSRRFVPDAGADPVLLTFSAGVASFPHEASDLSGLLRRADLRLNSAKSSGRNRVLARDA
ncbi:Diguanylate cyclase [Lysobacter dokdonensis DS-58]|uniref:diguanylate cyclase n=1 Tax=Lysobacter dokdonensis DS-58 TaxID=1300345 RepID=A0A0A2WFZ3_9GAMM|nr:GGDEF domain-containing protein [Lysobacter dokdonensis]KGQ18673.1 Diguanylate cyclase [Lysobacter dokdonensis DS-58]